MDFKVRFPSGYTVVSEFNDNIDIHVVLPTKEVYFATLFTLENVSTLTKKNKDNYFWAANMVLIENLKEETIVSVVEQMMKAGYFPEAFSKIGTIKDVYSKDLFSEI